MPLDAICLTAVAGELSEKLSGAKIDKVLQPSRDELHLLLHSRGGNCKLLLSASQQHPRAHFTTVTRENPSVPPMFCMLLRKHLIGGRFRAVTQPPMERVLIFELDCTDEMGAPCEKKLVCEIMGRHSNIILVGGDGRIIECLRRVDSEMSEKRQVLPGMFYRLPPAQDKLDFLAMPEDELKSLWGGKKPDIDADKWLLSTFNGLSPLICRELAARGMPESLIELRGTVGRGEFKPVMLVEEGNPRDFSFLEITQYDGVYQSVPCRDFSSMLDQFYTERDIRGQMAQKAQALLKRASGNRDRIIRKLAAQREELVRARDRERLRESGDLLMANLRLMKKGDESVTVLDFYSDTQENTEIKLDPTRSPQQNAAKYYKDYAKAKNAEAILEEQISMGEGDAEYWESVIEELQRVSGDKELQEIRDELVPRPSKAGKKEKLSAPMEFLSSEGVRIYAGRNNRQNDLLTFKLSGRSDIWLHTQKIPGCHVIVEAGADTPGEQTLLEAAMIAASFSKAKDSPKVPVDYTRVKYVKKPPGAKPGMVIYDKFSTILVSPDQSFLEKLKKT